MVYTEEYVQRQIRLGESIDWEFEQVEFKGERPVEPTRDRLADEITAFANAHGGVLLFGEELRLTDADGNEQWVRIVEIVGRSVLLEYRPASQST